MKRPTPKNIEDELREAIKSLDPVDNKIVHILSRSLLRILESVERTEKDISRMDGKLAAVLQEIAADNEYVRQTSRPGWDNRS